ncbi:MAG: phosphoadenylyl-sulfate reductase [Nitrospirales bacterium]
MDAKQTDPRPSPDQLKAVSDAFEPKSSQEVLAHAVAAYAPRLVLACSFGAEDVVLVDMIHRINPDVPLFYLDTDFLFPETHEVRDRIVARYGLRPEQVIRVTSQLTPAAQAAQHGDALWARNPDLCCHLRKIEPLTRVLKDYDAWITGIRREQAPTRAQAGLVEWDARFHLVKFNPLAAWTWDQVWAYIRSNQVPYNRLHDRQYPSIGCTHCTAPVQPGEDPRSGRWKDLEKIECGLHK